jgi:hypothetical protein
VSLSCWARKDRVYLDGIACAQLRDRVRDRWDRLAEDKGKPPNGPRVLARASVTHYMFALVGTRTARFWIFEPGIDEEVRVHELEANDDGLFDVTDLGLV